MFDCIDVDLSQMSAASIASMTYYRDIVQTNTVVRDGVMYYCSGGVVHSTIFERGFITSTPVQDAAIWEQASQFHDACATSYRMRASRRAATRRAALEARYVA